MFNNSGEKLKTLIKWAYIILVVLSVAAVIIIAAIEERAIGWALLGLIVYNIFNYIFFLIIDAVITLCVDTHKLAEYFVPHDNKGKDIDNIDIDDKPQSVFDGFEDSIAIPLSQGTIDVTYTIQRIEDEALAEKLAERMYDVGSYIVIIKRLSNGYYVEIDGNPCTISKESAEKIYIICDEG